jgi:hypothetical protein
MNTWDLLHAFERGVDDGFFRGDSENRYLGPSDEVRYAYQRGYDHGVWMYCDGPWHTAPHQRLAGIGRVWTGG